MSIPMQMAFDRQALRIHVGLSSKLRLMPTNILLSSGGYASISSDESAGVGSGETVATSSWDIEDGNRLRESCWVIAGGCLISRSGFIGNSASSNRDLDGSAVECQFSSCMLHLGLAGELEMHTASILSGRGSSRCGVGTSGRLSTLLCSFCLLPTRHVNDLAQEKTMEPSVKHTVGPLSEFVLLFSRCCDHPLF